MLSQEISSKIQPDLSSYPIRSSKIKQAEGSFYLETLALDTLIPLMDSSRSGGSTIKSQKLSFMKTVL